MQNNRPLYHVRALTTLYGIDRTLECPVLGRRSQNYVASGIKTKQQYIDTLRPENIVGV